MNEKEMQAVEEFAKYVERYNQRLFVVTLAAIVMTIILGLCALVTIEHINQDMADMSTEQWRAYMDADYYYPDIHQEQNIDIERK